MSQHDYNIANGGGAAVRSDINNALLAILSQNSGATAPTTTKPFMPWYDTTTGTVKIRNAADDGWISYAEMAGGGSALGSRNRLINPNGGGVYQRIVTSTADDVYFADRWYALTQTGAVTPSVLTDTENGYTHGVRITQSQATAQRFGYAQIIEGRNCKDMRNGSGVFAPRIRVSGSQAVRYAILGWTGTEDAVTSDVVNDWTSASFTAGGFFLAANVSVLAVGSQTPSANTWTTLANIYGALGSTFNNIIVMVWTESTAAQNFTLDFDWNQFEKGAIVTPPDVRQASVELALCQRYYWRWSSVNNSYLYLTTAGRAYSTTGGTVAIQHPVPMRTAPSLNHSNNFAAGNWDYGLSAISINNGGYAAFPFNITNLNITGAFAGADRSFALGAGSSTSSTIWIEFPAEL